MATTQRPLIAALETTFTPPAACFTTLEAYIDRNTVLLVPLGITATQSSYYGCWPPGYQQFAAANTGTEQGYYSPGVCPSGFTSACAVSAAGPESAALCCPRSVFLFSFYYFHLHIADRCSQKLRMYGRCDRRLRGDVVREHDCRDDYHHSLHPKPAAVRLAERPHRCSTNRGNHSGAGLRDRGTLAELRLVCLCRGDADGLHQLQFYSGPLFYADADSDPCRASHQHSHPRHFPLHQARPWPRHPDRRHPAWPDPRSAIPDPATAAAKAASQTIRRRRRTCANTPPGRVAGRRQAHDGRTQDAQGRAQRAHAVPGRN